MSAEPIPAADVRRLQAPRTIDRVDRGPATAGPAAAAQSSAQPSAVVHSRQAPTLGPYRVVGEGRYAVLVHTGPLMTSVVEGSEPPASTVSAASQLDETA